MSKAAEKYVPIQKRHDEAVSQVQAEAKAELKELEPYAKRYEEIKRYLSGHNGSTPEASDTPKPKPSSSPKPRASRSQGKKTHGDRLVEIVAQDPGLTGAELAKKLGISVSHLHQTRRKEVEKGRLKKVDRGTYEAVTA